MVVFSARAVERLRRRARTAGSFPWEGPEGWSRETADPMEVVRLFAPLAIRPGWVLRAYQFRSGYNGNGCVFAMPADSELPEPAAEALGTSPFEPSAIVPPGADLDVGRYLVGDGRPRTYLLASLLVRELRELGAMWHGVSWGHHDVLGAAPEDGRAEWTWYEEPPDEWRPSVTKAADRVTVRFYSYTAFVNCAITKHVDCFEPDSYAFATTEVVVASGPRGYIV